MGDGAISRANHTADFIYKRDIMAALGDVQRIIGYYSVLLQAHRFRSLLFIVISDDLVNWIKMMMLKRRDGN